MSKRRSRSNRPLPTRPPIAQFVQVLHIAHAEPRHLFAIQLNGEPGLLGFLLTRRIRRAERNERPRATLAQDP